MGISFNDNSISLELKSPFSGYRKMNFHVSFRYNDNLRITFKADKPVALRFELQSGHKNQGYGFMMNIETPVAGYEKISIHTEFPLDKTALKMILKLPASEYGVKFEFANNVYMKLLGGSIRVNGVEYGSGISMRYKAPYELAYFYSIPHNEYRFHIAMDSTMYDTVLY